MPVNKKKTKTIQKNKQNASFSTNDLAVFRQFVDIMKPMLSGEATNRHNQNDSSDESDSNFSSSYSASSDPRENDPSPTRVTRSTKESPTNDEKLSKNSSSKGPRRFTRSTATSTLTKHAGTTHSSTKRRSLVVNTRAKKKSKGTTQSSSVAALAPNTDPPTEIPPTENQVIPIQVDGNLDEEHWHRFNLRVFGNSFGDVSNLGTTSTSASNTKFMSRSQLNHEIYIKKHWKTGDPNAQGPVYDGAPDPRIPRGFCKLYPQGRSNKLLRREVRAIRLDNGANEYALFDRDLRVVAAEDVFDIIREKHIETGHKLSEETTYNAIKNDYHNITVRQVKEFINGCPQCMLQRRPQLPHKGASKPIRSFAFRDRYQADLIKMDEEGRTGARDIYGVEMHYILSCKDHFSQYVMLAAVPSKSPRYVAHHLGLFFGLIGFPAVYQSDNGPEVSGNEIIAMILQNNPHIDTCNGQPRTPREQGSVEHKQRDQEHRPSLRGRRVG